MIVQNLFQPFEIEYKELEACPIGLHRNTFFQLIYILRGSGTQRVNGNSFAYSADHFFLVMPQDKHQFEVKEITAFLVIKFNDIYLKARQVKEQHEDPGDWVPRLEYIFQHGLHLPGCLLRNQSDKPLVKSVVDALIREQADQQLFRREVTQQLVNTLITIVARNVSMEFPAEALQQQGAKTPQNLVLFIHRNIYTPEKLRAEYIAAHFNISLNYLSEYFKKSMGENLLQYIIRYKLRLAETRLQYSDLRINEIAAELGFTDESHLSRTFKKHKGMNPSAFRKATQLNK